MSVNARGKARAILANAKGKARANLHGRPWWQIKSPISSGEKDTCPHSSYGTLPTMVIAWSNNSLCDVVVYSLI